jgi:hypothetical protein
MRQLVLPLGQHVPVIEPAQHMQLPERCWDQWVASMECGIARTDYCPCDGNDRSAPPGAA